VIKNRTILLVRDKCIRLFIRVAALCRGNTLGPDVSVALID